MQFVKQKLSKVLIYLGWPKRCVPSPDTHRTMSHPAECPAQPSRIADTHCTTPTLKRATRRSQHDMGIKMFVGRVVRGHRIKRPSGPDGFRLAAAKKELSSRMNECCSSDSNNDWRDKLMDHKFLLRCARRVSEHEEFIRRIKDDSKSKRKPIHPLSNYKCIVSSKQSGVRRSRLPGAGRQFRFPDARKRLRPRVRSWFCAPQTRCPSCYISII